MWQQDSKTRWTAIVLTLTFFVTVVISMYILSPRQIPFSSEAWKTESDQRPYMVQSLLANHDLQGEHRDTINDLLGVPTGRDSVIGERYVYWAGTDGVIDDMWLEITFTNDRVADIQYVPD